MSEMDLLEDKQVRNSNCVTFNHMSSMYELFRGNKFDLACALFSLP